jgi:hypothetical protein
MKKKDTPRTVEIPPEWSGFSIMRAREGPQAEGQSALAKAASGPQPGTQPQVVKRSIVVRIDGQDFRHDWIGRPGDFPVSATNFLHEMTDRAVIDANPATRIEIRVE